MFKSILLSGIVLLSSAVFLPPIHAQYGTGSNFHDNLGNTYNNPSSALMGTAINGIMQQQVVSSAVRGSLSRSSSNSAATLSKVPNTVLFTPRTPPLQQWLDNWGQGDPQKRRQAYYDWVAQSAIWKSEIQRHSAKTNDFSQMFALALLIGYEAYTGQRPSHAAFVDITQNVRTVLLDTQKIRTFTNARKNELVEDQMLSATAALYDRRQGQKRGDATQIAQARSAAESFLDKWWHGQHNELVKRIAAKAPANSPIANASSPAKELSFERAVQLTNFKRVSPTLLPEKLGQSLPEEQHPQEMERVARELIQQARKQLDGSQAKVPVDNVSLAMTYSLLKLYVIASTPKGSRLGQGVKLPSQTQQDALYRRLTQNLASNADFVQIPDQQKQELSEVLLFTPEFAQQMYNYAQQKGNTQMQSQAQEIARTSFERFFGVDPKNFSF